MPYERDAFSACLSGENEHDAGSGHGTNTGASGDEAAQFLEVRKEIDHAGGFFRVGHEEETGNNSGDNGYGDESHQGGCFFGHDQTSISTTVRKPRNANMNKPPLFL